MVNTLRMITNDDNPRLWGTTGGNHRPACARYNKALTHAAKFLDMTPDQKEQVGVVVTVPV